MASVVMWESQICPQCILVRVGTAARLHEQENSAFLVSISRTLELLSSVDYIYHQHWLDITWKVRDFPFKGMEYT